MKKNKEEIKLVEDWLSFARENLLFAHSGMKEIMRPIIRYVFCVREARRST